MGYHHLQAVQVLHDLFVLTVLCSIWFAEYRNPVNGGVQSDASVQLQVQNSQPQAY